jgi:hypothetical protein
MTVWSAVSPRYIEIVVTGEFGDPLETELDDVAVTVAGGETHLRVLTRDASELYAVLDRLAALGFELLSVHPLDETPPP